MSYRLCLHNPPHPFRLDANAPADPPITTHIFLWGCILEPFTKKMRGDDEYLKSFTKGFAELPSPAQVHGALSGWRCTAAVAFAVASVAVASVAAAFALAIVVAVESAVKNSIPVRCAPFLSWWPGRICFCYCLCLCSPRSGTGRKRAEHDGDSLNER